MSSLSIFSSDMAELTIPLMRCSSANCDRVSGSKLIFIVISPHRIVSWVHDGCHTVDGHAKCFKPTTGVGFTEAGRIRAAYVFVGGAIAGNISVSRSNGGCPHCSLTLFFLLRWSKWGNDPEIQFVYARGAGVDVFHGFVKVFGVGSKNEQATLIVLDVGIPLFVNELGNAHFCFSCA